MVINKEELVAQLADAARITKDSARANLNLLIDGIKAALVDGDVVRLAGLGTFSVKDTAERNCINPRTGERMTAPASRRVSFKAASDLKAAVKG